MAKAKPLLVHATYDLARRNIHFIVQGPQGTITSDMEPEQFAKMMEYLETFWSSYSEWRKQNGV